MAAISATDAGTSAEVVTSRGVCWDVDGTLADSFLLGYSATKDVLSQAGYSEPSGDEYHAFCIYTTPVRLARHAGLEPDTDEFERIGADLGRKFDDMYIALVSTETAAFFPGVLDIVAGLGDAKVPLGALTNAAVGYAEAVLSVNGVREIFSSVHGADDVPAPKPNPDGIAVCLSEMGLEAQELVYVGDSPSDGKAARAAGCKSVGVAWGSHPVENLTPQFDIVVHTPEELHKALTCFIKTGSVLEG